jgi:hypothetical protein
MQDELDESIGDFLFIVRHEQGGQAAQYEKKIKIIDVPVVKAGDIEIFGEKCNAHRELV